VEFISAHVGTGTAQALNNPFDGLPELICAWIFTECDIPDVHNNSRLLCKNKTFSQALKMRAAVSFHYNELGRGSNSWHKLNDGSWSGNPSLSNSVSQYMLSLQRRKVTPLQNDDPGGNDERNFHNQS
jgi:hypothetical protein